MSSQYKSLPPSGGGGGAVDSVNGQTGVVVLDADDVGAASQQLDNLSSTAVNADIVPDGNDTRSLGSNDDRWLAVYSGELNGGGGSILVDSDADINLSGASLSINSTPTIFGDGANARPLFFNDKDNTNQISFSAPDVLSENSEYTWPDTIGSAGQVLTDVAGDGILSWQNTSGGASQQLDNLSSTAINANLTFDAGSYGMGGPKLQTAALGSGQSLNLTVRTGSSGDDSTGGLSLSTGFAAGSQSGPLSLITGGATDVSGGISLTTGDADQTGDIVLAIGVAGTTTGKIYLQGLVQVQALLNLFNSNSDPAGAVAGDIYYNTGSNKIKLFNGSTWETVTSS